MIGIYLMRFLTLGAEINMKYRNNTVLLTEQVRKFAYCSVSFNFNPVGYVVQVFHVGINYFLLEKCDTFRHFYSVLICRILK